MLAGAYLIMLADASLCEVATVPDDKLPIDACRSCQWQMLTKAHSLHGVFMTCRVKPEKSWSLARWSLAQNIPYNAFMD